MTKPEDDDRVMSLVELALGQPPETREAWLRTACEDDTKLFSQVWDYVEWNERMQNFLLEPVYSVLADHRFAPGELLADRFRIVREVARGGMGIVYEAEDERLGRRVALKCARSGFSGRLPPEVRHASEISHPNVCKIFDIHTASTPRGDIDFLTMEFLEGETLAERLRAGPLTEAEAMAIASQLCEGLAEAHRKGVVHGDLKSNNVILTSGLDGAMRAVITDFGLARRPSAPLRESGAAQLLQSAPVGGAPAYMAPELRTGTKPTPASDVYALGVILSELFSSERPNVSSQWDGVLARCLDPDPALRFADAGVLLHALQPPRSRRWWMGAVAAVVLAGISGLVTYQRATAPRETMRLAMLPFQSSPDTADIASQLSRDAASQLALLKGNSRAKVIFLNKRDISGATHVVSGTISRENGKVVLESVLTNARTQAHVGDWKAEYAPADVHFAGAAMAGMVTASLHLPPLAIASVNAAAKQNYLAGLDYTRRNSTVDKALRSLESAVAADPDSPLTWVALAEAEYFKYFITKEQGWLDRAGESLRQAQSRDPDLAQVHRVAGILRFTAGFYEQAQEEYQRAIELDPNNGEIYRRLGQVYDRSNRPDQSLEAYRKATQLDSNSVRACQSLGTFHRAHGQYSEAARQFEKCVTLDPDEADAHFALGTAYLDSGRYPEAERELGRAIELNETPAALNNLAEVLANEGKDTEAIPKFVRALKLSPDQDLWWINLGDAYFRTSRKEEATKAYRQALELAEKEITHDPHDGILRSRLAYACARLNDRARAESELAQALHDSPGDTSVMEVHVYEALGQREKTMAILRNSPDQVLLDISRDPNLAELRRDPRFKELLDTHRKFAIEERNK